MTPVAYVAVGEKTSPRWCRAFAQGCGGTVAPQRRLHPGPVAMFGSRRLWGLLEQARAEGRDWYYGDHGYFGRFTFYRVTRNAHQHTGRGEPAYTRLKALGVTVAPWRRGGGHVLVCPPDQIFAGLFGFDGQAWAENIVAELRGRTDREIRVRSRHGNQDRPLWADLEDCWALVTFMSNAAVEAVLAGVPVFCTGRCAALTMGSDDLSLIESPRRPHGRRRWAAVLAANQWTMDELRDGACWEAIGR